MTDVARRVRAVSIAPLDTSVHRGSDGVVYMRSRHRLGAYPNRITERLEYWADRAPDRPFLAQRDATGSWRHVSYADALARVRRLSQALLDRNLSRDRPVIILSGNSIEHGLLALAAMFSGVMYAPVAPAYSLQAKEFGLLAQIFERLQPGLVFAAEGAAFERALGRVLPAGVELVVSSFLPERSAAPAALAATPFAELEAVPAASAVDEASARVGPDTIAKILFTSGSTGRPKGIVHLQHDMAYSDKAFAHNVLKLTPDDICFSVPKIFFAYGFGNSITFPFSAGAATLLLPGQPKPQAIFEAIERYRPTVFFGLPTLYTSLTKAEGAARGDFASLRMALSAAEVLSADVFQGWKRLTGLEIVEGLGSTEVLHIYLCNRAEKKKPGAAGLRVPGYEIALRDSNRRDVADDEEGILWVRGDSNTPLYWNRPDKSAETIREGGWIYTGDRFVRDKDEFYFFRGRADDLIKISGQWVYPLEVELCLAEHPDVRECAVFAAELPDRRMTLKAIVVMNSAAFDAGETAKDLQDFVKAKLLPYKYPREITFIDELPKTGTGKIDRQALLKV